MANPALVLGGASIGADLLSGLLGGGNPRQLKEMYDYIQNLLNQDEDVLPVGKISDQLDYMQAPGIDAEATRLSKRLGLSSPLAQAGLAKMNQGFKQQSRLDLLTQNALAKNQRKMSLTQLLASLSGQFE